MVDYTPISEEDRKAYQEIADDPNNPYSGVVGRLILENLALRDLIEDAFRAFRFNKLLVNDILKGRGDDARIKTEVNND